MADMGGRNYVVKDDIVYPLPPPIFRNESDNVGVMNMRVVDIVKKLTRPTFLVLLCSLMVCLIAYYIFRPAPDQQVCSLFSFLSQVV